MSNFPLSGGLRPPATILQPCGVREPFAEREWQLSESSMLCPYTGVTDYAGSAISAAAYFLP
jgi:hypothetical protein